MTDIMHVTIDLNVRVHGNQTYAGFEDVPYLPQLGEKVYAHEIESNLCAPAVVTDIDMGKGIIYLAVKWSDFGGCRHAVV